MNLASPVATLRRVSLNYGRKQALKTVDLDVPPGRMVGLIGPDGVGKSSVLSLIAGAQAVRGGQVTVLGGNGVRERFPVLTPPNPPRILPHAPTSPHRV